jgi:hypothetical protein
MSRKQLGGFEASRLLASLPPATLNVQKRLQHRAAAPFYMNATPGSLSYQGLNLVQLCSSQRLCRDTELTATMLDGAEIIRSLLYLHHRCCLETLFDPLVWWRKAKRIEIRSDHPIHARIFRAQGLGITENLIYDRDRDKDKALPADLLRFLLLLTAVCLAKSVPQRNR